MEYGYYSDCKLPEGVSPPPVPGIEYKLNSHGYRCPEWKPFPTGKKNVVIVGCSHTFGQGNKEDQHWVHHLSQHNTSRLRYWNLGQPGASGDKVVRILYGCEKMIFPNIIIICWPAWSRREKLDDYAKNITSDDEMLKYENEHTDKNNFLKNVFLVEKLAEKNYATTFHCFAQDPYDEHIPKLNVLEKVTLKNCWPRWDSYRHRRLVSHYSHAVDGIHYGVEHHERFAECFLEKFGNKLK